MKKINLHRDKESRAAIAQPTNLLKEVAPLTVVVEEVQSVNHERKENEKIPTNQAAKKASKGKASGDKEEA